MVSSRDDPERFEGHRGHDEWKVSMFGAIHEAVRGVTLTFVPFTSQGRAGKITSDVMNTLFTVLYDDMKRLELLDRPVYWDNAPVHCSVETLATRRVFNHFACVSPRSPELNPIEYIWHDVVRRVNSIGRWIDSKETWIRAIYVSFMSVATPEHVRGYVASCLKNAVNIVEHNGSNLYVELPYTHPYRGKVHT
jgi:hypothetical protein